MADLLKEMYRQRYAALVAELRFKAKQDQLLLSQITPQWVQLATARHPDAPPLEACSFLAEQLRDLLLMEQSPALAMMMGWATGKDKREPDVLLADEFLTDIPKLQKIMSTHGQQRRMVEAAMTRYKIALRKANRFSLDDELTRLVTEVANNTPAEKMAKRLGSAVVPYETTWIEFPLRVKVKVSRDAGLTIDKGRADMADVPEKLGLLIERDFQTPTAFAVTMVSQMTHGRDEEQYLLTTPVPSVYLFDLNRHPDRVAGHRSYESDAAVRLAEIAWGYTEQINDQQAQVVVPEGLKGHAAVAASPLHLAVIEVAKTLSDVEKQAKYLRVVFEDFSGMALEHAGMLRWTMTLLAMLAEVPVRHTAIAPKGSRMVGNLRKPFMDFHKLTIKVPKTRAVQYLERKLDKAAARRHRAHEVRSHWRTYLNEMQERCDHRWEYDHENGYRLCGKCMAYGRLIKEHIRGDASLGWVRKDYSLVANRAAPQIHKVLP